MASLTYEQIEQQLSARFKEGFLSLKDLPHPHTFKDMQRATKRIAQAIHNKEHITLIGDYDVDGIVSTSLVVDFFKRSAIPLTWKIPNRFKDGYGLSAKLVEDIPPNSLVITVDNGIAAIEAAKRCQEKNITLIITDHHMPSVTLPEAYAIVDQKQEACSFTYGEVCGAQIAWYLIASLKDVLGVDAPMQSYLGMVAIAIVADMMPLQHINRAMLIAGLKVLNQTSQPAIRAFFEATGKQSMNEQDIGFTLAPLLNASGRMEDASMAVDFLLSSNIASAHQHYIKLQSLNETRKAIEAQITKEALAQVNALSSVIVVVGQEWHEGVLGIVASRVSEKYEKPSIVLTEASAGVFKGSGRSYAGVNLFESVGRHKALLEKFGGHKEAIGLSIDEANLNRFIEQMTNAKLMVDGNHKEERQLGELDFALVNRELITLLSKYAPYGMSNTLPRFTSSGVVLKKVVTMGKTGEHKRLSVIQGVTELSAVKFRCTLALKEGEKATLSYQVNENHYNGKTTLQLLVEHIE